MSEDIWELSMDELGQVVGGVNRRIMAADGGVYVKVMSSPVSNAVVAQLGEGYIVDTLNESHPSRVGDTEWLHIRWIDLDNKQLHQGWIDAKYLNIKR